MHASAKALPLRELPPSPPPSILAAQISAATVAASAAPAEANAGHSSQLEALKRQVSSLRRQLDDADKRAARCEASLTILRRNQQPTSQQTAITSTPQLAPPPPPPKRISPHRLSPPPPPSRLPQPRQPLKGGTGGPCPLEWGMWYDGTMVRGQNGVTLPSCCQSLLWLD